MSNEKEHWTPRLAALDSPVTEICHKQIHKIDYHIKLYTEVTHFQLNICFYLRIVSLRTVHRHTLITEIFLIADLIFVIVRFKVKKYHLYLQLS